MPRKTTAKGGRKTNKKTEPTPNLIYQDTQQAPENTTPNIEEKLEKFRQTQTKAKSWMWLGVIGISAIIFFFWGWSIISRISLFNWNKTQENKMIIRTQEDWNDIFTKIEKEEKEKKELKQQINLIIEDIKKQAEKENTENTTTTITTTTTDLEKTTTTITSTISN